MNWWASLYGPAVDTPAEADAALSERASYRPIVFMPRPTWFLEETGARICICLQARQTWPWRSSAGRRSAAARSSIPSRIRAATFGSGRGSRRREIEGTFHCAAAGWSSRGGEREATERDGRQGAGANQGACVSAVRRRGAHEVRIVHRPAATLSPPRATRSRHPSDTGARRGAWLAPGRTWLRRGTRSARRSTRGLRGGTHGCAGAHVVRAGARVLTTTGQRRATAQACPDAGPPPVSTAAACPRRGTCGARRGTCGDDDGTRAPTRAAPGLDGGTCAPAGARVVRATARAVTTTRNTR